MLEQGESENVLSSQLKLALIGIDGACWSYIEQPMKKGLMPTVKKMMSSGVTGTLQSVVPYQTPATWSSIVTGSSPGSHGIFGWWTPDWAKSTLRAVSANDRCGAPIWRNLNEHGLRVGVVNIPITHPVEAIDGFIVAGLGTPFEKQWLHDESVFPRSVRCSAAEKGYEVLKLWEDDCKNLREHVEDWREMELNRARLTNFWVEQHGVDVLICAFHMPAYFHHVLPRGDELLDVVYQTMDECIGIVADFISSDGSMLLISDHGAEELDRNFYIQNWLVNEGYLAFNNSVPEENVELILEVSLDEVVHLLDAELEEEIVSSVLEWWRSLEELPRKAISQLILNKFPNSNMAFSNINWDQTSVYTYSNYGQLWVNRIGREPHGIVAPGQQYERLLKEVCHKLSELQDPATGACPFSRVSRSSEFYSCKLARDAPDITAEIGNPKTYWNSIFRYHVLHESLFGDAQEDANRLGKSAWRRRGMLPRIADHTREGIIILKSPHLKDLQNINASLEDISPTILSLLGIGDTSTSGMGIGDTDTPKNTNDQAAPESRDVSSDAHQQIANALRNLGYRI